MSFSIYQPNPPSSPNNHRHLQEGIVVYTGPMKSGKSEAVIRNLKRYWYAGVKTALFSPILDDRYSKTEVITHSRISHPAIKINNPQEIYDHIQTENNEPIAIGIDESMMFNSDLIPVCSNLRREGHPIFLSCCDMDVFLNPFKMRDWQEGLNETVIGNLLAIANKVYKLTAICEFNENGHICGNEASYTRLREGINEAEFLEGIVVGVDSYQTVCGIHHPFLK